jgi:hypothetical protein
MMDIDRLRTDQEIYLLPNTAKDRLHLMGKISQKTLPGGVVEDSVVEAVHRQTIIVPQATGVRYPHLSTNLPLLLYTG